MTEPRTGPSFASRLRQRELLVGTFVKTPAHQNVELLAQCGLDFLVLDTEHAPFGMAELDACLMASQLMRIPALVRIASARAEYVMQALDLGASGVLVPHVNSSLAAAESVSAARYRHGSRGYSNSPRAGGYGRKTMAQTLDDGDTHTSVICQIEDRSALAAIETIAATPGVACLFIGRADLAVSMGLEKLDHPAMDAAIEAVCRAGEKHHVAIGIFLPDTRLIDKYRALGITFFVIGSDQSILQDAATRMRLQVQAA